MEFVVQLFDLGLLRIILLSIIFIQDLALRRCAYQQCLIDQPPTLVVLDVRANLADEGGIAKRIEVVILDLEVLAQRYEDVV